METALCLPRMLILSDLHLEMHDYAPIQEGYDLVVLAGDIHTRDRGVAWAQRSFSTPVVYVPGNHEGWGTHWQKNIDKMRRMSEGSHVHVLDCRAVEIQGVRFLGATSWSNFSHWPDQRAAMAAAGEGAGAYSPGAKDYRHIRTAGYRRIVPADTATWSTQARAWLQHALAQPFDGPTVVVSHHPPTALSLPNGVATALDASDANDWDQMILDLSPDMWIHGHTHHPVDYLLGRTRMFSNPRGYPGEHTGYRDDAIIVPGQRPSFAAQHLPPRP